MYFLKEALYSEWAIYNRIENTPNKINYKYLILK